MYELNGQAFLRFLEEMTGIKGLISDPYYLGGRLHATKRGGHLSVHADFNIHAITKLERRHNLLVYLNEDWPAEWGGELELWDKKMKTGEVKIAPLLERAVVFSTILDSYHGHPEPLACPPEQRRRSIATYYYTGLDVDAGLTPHRGANFRPRPATGDKVDWATKRMQFISDWMPPALRRVARRIRHRV